jgi:hypothetical protein
MDLKSQPASRPFIHPEFQIQVMQILGYHFRMFVKLKTIENPTAIKHCYTLLSYNVHTVSLRNNDSPTVTSFL